MSLDASQMAKALWSARRDGGRLPPPQGLDEETAFAIQDALIAAAAGHPVIAWKVGGTGPGIPEKMGIASPLVGPIFERYVHVADGDEPVVELPAAHGLAVEVELVFRFGEDLAPGDSPSDVLDLVDGVAVGIEFPGSRWTSPTEPSGPGIIADHAGNSALLVGSSRTGATWIFRRSSPRSRSTASTPEAETARS